MDMRPTDSDGGHSRAPTLDSGLTWSVFLTDSDLLGAAQILCGWTPASSPLLGHRTESPLKPTGITEDSLSDTWDPLTTLALSDLPFLASWQPLLSVGHSTPDYMNDRDGVFGIHDATYLQDLEEQERVTQAYVDSLSTRSSDEYSDPSNGRRRQDTKRRKVLGLSQSVNCSASLKKRAQRKEPVSNLEKRWCGHCEAIETPMWRNGPVGFGNLCNKVGTFLCFNSGCLPIYGNSAESSGNAVELCSAMFQLRVRFPPHLPWKRPKKSFHWKSSLKNPPDCKYFCYLFIHPSFSTCTYFSSSFFL